MGSLYRLVLAYITSDISSGQGEASSAQRSFCLGLKTTFFLSSAMILVYCDVAQLNIHYWLSPAASSFSPSLMQ